MLLDKRIDAIRKIGAQFLRLGCNGFCLLRAFRHLLLDLLEVKIIRHLGGGGYSGLFQD